MVIREISAVSKDSGKGKEQSIAQISIPSDPYAKATRVLSEEEMNSSAVQKLLLSENDRKDREIDRLKSIEDLYYKRDKDASILEEKLKQSTGAEVLFTVCETGGSALAGVSGIFWNYTGGWILLVIGVLFIIGGILFKFVKR